MSPDLSLYHQRATALLLQIQTVVDSVAGDSIDVEEQSDVVSLTCPGKRVYIVNKSAPLQQIWLSSPLSGAWHFSWQAGPAGEGGDWVSTRGGQETLLSLLGDELEQITGQSFDWTQSV